MIFAFFNFNSYLGGGETLIVRLAQYLRDEGYDFKLFYKKGSYIETDLDYIKISQDYRCPIVSNESYYYLNEKGRKKLRDEISSYLSGLKDVCLVSLNTRELYTLTDIAKNNPDYKLSHLVLHDQDNLYVCQSVFDKILQRITGIRRFSRKKHISFNTKLFNVICEQSILIPQSELQSDLLKNKYGINTEKTKVVPLPVCDFSKIEYKEPINNKKIIWIGRIVDFKIPALLAMIRFVSRNTEYSLSVIGDGELDYVRQYMKNNNINEENIYFLGKKKYSELEDIIKGHSIGYAMGTSIIEIGKYSLPVIMALGSPDFKVFKDDICGGLYVHQGRGNVGDTLYYEKSGEPIVLISEAIDELKEDYGGLSIKCFDALKNNFDERSNFESYLNLLGQSQTIYTDISIPKASWLRSVLFRIV